MINGSIDEELTYVENAKPGRFERMVYREDTGVIEAIREKHPGAIPSLQFVVGET